MRTVSERDVDRLIKILDYCDKIEDCTESLHNSYEAFAENVIYQDAAEMNLFQIGEQANHLSDKCVEQMGDVPWHQIIGLRNIIAHGYDTIQVEQIWNTMVKDVPDLKKKISEFLSDIGESEWL